jgi:hypothetical protein
MLADFHLRWLDVGRSFWISLGWGTIRPQSWVYTILFIFSLLSLVGLVAGFRRWRQQPSPRSGRNTLVLLGILILALAFVVVFLEWWMRRVIAPYGRLLFPTIGSIVILMTLGWRTLHPKLPLLPLGFVAGLALFTPTWLILPAYTPPPLLSSAETAELSPIIGWQFSEPGQEPFAELLTVTPLVESAYGESVLPIRVCWRALGATERNYAVLIQVIGPNNSLIAGRRSYPGQGHYPTSLWQPGDTFCDQMHVQIWKNIPETLVYQIEITLYDEEQDERLLAFDRSGNPLFATFIDRVRLVAQDTEDADPLNLAAGQNIQLVSSDIPATWHLGQENDFTVSWGTAEPLEIDYQLFVHLRDPSSGEIVAQADGPPLDGWYPTSWWSIQELIVDKRTFLLPADLVAGTYDLVVGFYDLVSDQRFGEEYPLGSITVAP